MISCFILLLYAYTISGIGYDAGGGDRASCGRPYRAGRIYQPPCDLERFGYCAHAGQLYPWKAVKRFVKDNQGLMRRMYGDQRHGHVLKAELDDIEDLDMNENEHWRPTSVRFAKYLHDDDNYLEASMEYSDDINEEESRYLKDDLTNDDVLNTKFVISEQEAAVAIKLAELKAAAHFRPIHHRAQYTTHRTVSPPWQTLSTTQKAIQRNVTKLIPATVKKDTTTTTEKVTTGSSVASESLDDFTLSSSSTFAEDSITEATTDRTTEVEKLSSTTTSKINIEDLDPTAQASETFEMYGEINEAPLKPDDGKKPAILFQDMESENKRKGSMNFNNAKGVNACPVKEEVVAPFWANNTRGEVLALLNMYPFEQYVHWEKCTFEHRQMYCREGCRCEQQYRLHRLLAYDPNNECRGIFSDWFRFPSCCVCKCYDMPPEFRVTSRSPRYQKSYSNDEDEEVA